LILSFSGDGIPSNVLRDGPAGIFSWDRVHMAEGTIKKLTDKGFGFISMGGSKDLFFHSKALQGVSFDDLREGQKVSFSEGQGPKGPCAENVRAI
jgi:CspA family cold shock protein